MIAIGLRSLHEGVYPRQVIDMNQGGDRSLTVPAVTQHMRFRVGEEFFQEGIADRVFN